MPAFGRPLYWFTFGLYAVLIAWQALSLPDRVPAHMDAAGNVDRWGSKTEHLVMATLLGGLMLMLGPGMSVLMRKVPRSLVNVPHPEHWKSDEHWPEAQRRMTESMWGFGCITNLFFAFLMISVTEEARGRDWPGWGFWIAVALFLAATGLWCIGLYRNLRVPPRPRHPSQAER